MHFVHIGECVVIIGVVDVVVVEGLLHNPPGLHEASLYPASEGCISRTV